MPDLNFQIEGAEPVPFAAAPTLALKLRIENLLPEEPIHSALLRCQVQIAATRRRYGPEEQERLYELFGEPAQWGDSLRSLLWTHLQANVPAFTGGVRMDLLLPCTFDFNVSATKFFAGLDDGEVPLELLFSGAVFYAGEHGGLQVMQIPWEKEASYRLPVRIWREMMDHYYPNSVWLRVPRDVFDRLHRYKSRRAIPTWEQTLERLLDQGNPPPAVASE